MENFSEIIEKWYIDNQRKLPWRETKDPYKIWISEIILQQTQVKQGYDYYLRFVDRFPNIRTLAEASEQEVLKYWQGLGYYSRARNLHAAAKTIENEMGGIFPGTYKEIRSLKGIGDYTAAAISSFAYNLPEAVLDGNVYRVLARYFAIDTPIDTTEGKKYFMELSKKMLDKQNPALYNQAIMDFGAIQCTPQNPTCLFCPLQDSCASYNESTTTKYPVKAKKTKVQDVYFTYLYLIYKGKFLLHKRSGKGIWKNMYELPLIESNSAEEQQQVLTSNAFKQWMTFFHNPLIRLVAKDIKHVLSHRVIHAQCYLIEIGDFLNEKASNLSEVARKNDCVCVSLNELENYPLPRLITLILEKLT